MSDPTPAPGSERPAAGEETSPSPASPAPVPVRLDERSFTRLVPQLFIFPLVLVTIIVMIYVLFGASAENDRSVPEILSDLHSGWFQTKNRAAYDLAMRTLDMSQSGEKFSPDVTREIIRVLEANPDNPKVRSYLFRALGTAGDPELSRPVLLSFLAEESRASLEERIEAIRGLGLSRSPEAIPPLMEQLASFQAEADWEPRLITLSALANIGSGPQSNEALRRSTVETLRKYLTDPRWMVRWNVASVLARQFRDSSGIEILRNLLDREFIASTDEKLKVEKHQEDWVILGIRGLLVLEDEASYSKIIALRQDPSARVRNTIYLWEEERARQEP